MSENDTSDDDTNEYKSTALIEQNKVFQRFYRGKGNTEEGAGLGLAMVQRILEIHNAEIRLGKSMYGGLQFDIYFNPAKFIPIKNSKPTQDRGNTKKSNHVTAREIA